MRHIHQRSPKKEAHQNSHCSDFEEYKRIAPASDYRLFGFARALDNIGHGLTPRDSTFHSTIPEHEPTREHAESFSNFDKNVPALDDLCR